MKLFYGVINKVCASGFRYAKFYSIQEIDTKGAKRSALFDIDGVLYVAIPFYKGQSSGFSAASELWKRGDSYGMFLAKYVLI